MEDCEGGGEGMRDSSPGQTLCLPCPVVSRNNNDLSQERHIWRGDGGKLAEDSEDEGEVEFDII